MRAAFHQAKLPRRAAFEKGAYYKHFAEILNKKRPRTDSHVRTFGSDTSEELLRKTPPDRLELSTLRLTAARSTG